MMNPGPQKFGLMEKAPWSVLDWMRPLWARGKRCDAKVSQSGSSCTTQEGNQNPRGALRARLPQGAEVQGQTTPDALPSEAKGRAPGGGFGIGLHQVL